MSEQDSPSESSPDTQWTRDLQDPAKFEDAARMIWEKYHPLVERHIAINTADELREEISPDSVAQVTFNSFFQRQAAGKFTIQDRGGLLGLLRRIAFRKLVQRVRERKADKRTPGQTEKKRQKGAGESSRESALDDSPTSRRQAVTPAELEGGKRVVYPEALKRHYRPSLPVDSSVSTESEHEGAELDLLLREVEPEVRATAREAAEKLDDNLRPVFLLYIQNFTNPEIADQLDIEPGAVLRRIDMIRDRWSELYGQ